MVQKAKKSDSNVVVKPRTSVLSLEGGSVTVRISGVVASDAGKNSLEKVAKIRSIKKKRA